MPCAWCGEPHPLTDMDYAFRLPDAVLAVPSQEREERCDWTDDLAEVDREHCFIRGVVSLPVRGHKHEFGLGVWAHVSRDGFRRYLARYSDDDQQNEPAFAGTIANMVPSYPPTLGVPVMIRLTGATTRPVFIVEPCGHPLSEEQRNGVQPERVMRILAPGRHPDASPPLGEPRLATLLEDAWTLERACDLHGASDGTDRAPLPDLPHALRPGTIVKLIFLILSSDPRGQPVEKEERMWVEVDHRGEGIEPWLSGMLLNRPYAPGVVHPGLRVWFRAEHVLAIAEPESEPASTRP